MPIPDHPIDHTEQYLARMLGRDSALPKHPVTRTHQYLAALAEQTAELKRRIDEAISGAPQSTAPQETAALPEIGHTITRDRFVIFENESLTREVIGSSIRYSFSGLTRDSDLPEMPSFSDTCWIRIPEEFVRGVLDGKAKTVFRLDSEPMPDRTFAECEYESDGLDGERIRVFLQADYSAPGKWDTGVYSFEGGGGFQGGARYLDAGTIPALSRPEDYGWYFSVKRSVASVLGTGSWDAERYAPAPETVKITVYLEKVDVEFDPDLRQALSGITGGPEPIPTLVYSSPDGWILDGLDPDRLDPYKIGNSAIPAAIDPSGLYGDEILGCTAVPLSGGLYVYYLYDDQGHPGEIVEMHLTGISYVEKYTYDGGDMTLTGAALETYTADRYREQDPDTGEPGEWHGWETARLSTVNLTALTTPEYTPLGSTGEEEEIH